MGLNDGYSMILDIFHTNVFLEWSHSARKLAFKLYEFISSPYGKYLPSINNSDSQSVSQNCPKIVFLLLVWFGFNFPCYSTKAHCLAVDRMIRKFLPKCDYSWNITHPLIQWEDQTKTIIGLSPPPIPVAMHPKFLYSFEDTSNDYVIYTNE